MSHTAGLEPQTGRGMALFFVATALSRGYAALLPCANRSFCGFGFRNGMAEGTKAACAPIVAGRHCSLLCAVDFLPHHDGDLRADQRFCRPPDGSGEYRRARRMATAVADDQIRERRIRRLRRDEA